MDLSIFGYQFMQNAILSGVFGGIVCATIGVFVVASALCAVAANLEWLVAARVLQGIGAGAGPALGRAIPSC